MGFKNKIRGIREIWQFENRWQLLFTRFFFSDEKINIYRFKEIEFLSDHSAGDANGAREVLTSDMYRKFFPKMNLAERLKVLDLGSNNGGFSLLLKSEGLDISKLVCVEFDSGTFSRLQFNLDRNFDCEHVAMNVAVCGESKTLQVKAGGASTSRNIYSENNSSGYSLQLIEGLTFNQIFDQHFSGQIVDICKIDVEGAEFEIFAKSGFEEITNCRYLLIEIHHEKGRPRSEVLKVLHEVGFTEIEGELKSDELHYVHFFANNKLV